MIGISLLFGAIVGLALGLTGGGGAIFAVPMLVYGLGVAPREAVGISLAAVGATSSLGALHRWKLGHVELRTGMLFAVAGMAGAPAGAWLAGRIPEPLLILLFAVLMVIVAVRLWQQASSAINVHRPSVASEDVDGPACRRDALGTLLLNSRCAVLLVMVGIGAGVLSGLFGVGGGFVIVPALVLFSGMSMHRAVGTSLVVITLVSLSGVASHVLQGRTIDAAITSMFIIGGLGGLAVGHRVGGQLSGPTLQKTFAIAILAVAVFVIAQSLYS